MLGTKQPTAEDYTDGRTKQTFKDETDINKILQRAEKTGTISHINKHQGSYSDFADFDYFGNLQMLTRGREIFDDLPAELRNEFQNSPAGFFDYVNDPANKDRLPELLPALAAPGRQLKDVRGNKPADVVAAEAAIEETTPTPGIKEGSKAPPAKPESAKKPEKAAKADSSDNT